MKILLFSLILSGASAGWSNQGGVSPEAKTSNWFCTAEGYDPATRQNRQVSGDDAPTQQEAERSALRRCMMMYQGCLVKSCFDMGLPSVH